MKKLNRMTSLLLALVLALSIAVLPASAVDIDSENTASSETVISPRAATLLVDKSLSDIEDTRGSGVVSFNISSKEPYYRISITNNNPRETLTFQLTYKDKDGDPIWSKTVSATSSATVTDKVSSYGTYYISVSSNPHGETLSGKISVRVASNKDLLG